MSLSVTLLLGCFVLLMMLTDLKASTNPPYPTSSYPQLVRQFYTTRDGLPSDEVQAIAITREGIVLAAAGDAVVKFENGRWAKMSGPSDPAALLATQKEVDALAGTPQGIWALSNGTWRKEEGSPANVIAFSVEPGGVAWALAPSGVWRREGGWKQVHRLDDEMVKPRGLCAVNSEKVYVAAESGLFGLMGKRKYWLRLEVRSGGLLSNNTRAVTRLDKDHLLVATNRGLNLTDGQRGWHSFTGAEGLPILNLTEISVGEDGTVWLGSDQGVVRWSGGSWTYLAGQRWLPDNRVTALAADKDGSVWVGTPKGLAHITHRPMTLAEKAQIYQKDLESRNRRHGYVTVMQLPAPGVLKGSIQEISDNDGLWTALYIASQSFRYAVTKSPEARAQAWRSMQALLRLESITGIPGFPARAICHKDEPGFPLRSARSLPEWHPSPVEKDWWWKGDTSSDELDGHFFAWYVFYELAANEEEKKKVRATCKRVMDHILDHNYTLVDIDGKHTTWGVWSPEKLNDDPMWWEERGLNSLEILSHLKVAHYIVGDTRYERAYRELIEKHHYAINTINTKIPTGVSHDDQLAFLSFYPLLQLEQDPALRAIYLAGLKRTWAYERVEASPFWNFIYGACTGEPCDVEAAVQSLREMPLDFIDWEMKNSHRADLKFNRLPGRTGEKRLSRPLSWIERPMHKWDKDPYLLDGGAGRGEVDQTLWLLPYWLGRYHRLIE